MRSMVDERHIFFNTPPPPRICPLPLPAPLPISTRPGRRRHVVAGHRRHVAGGPAAHPLTTSHRTEPAPHDGRRPHGADRKSTRLNSSHANISYAVLCLKKKKHFLDSRTATVSAP